MDGIALDQLKLLTIGDSGVGKTWLLLRWAGATGKLSNYSSSMPTIGIDFKMRTVLINGKKVKIQIWDTAGQERFRTITTSYYRHCQGILLVYDITDGTTFASIRSWIAQINMHADHRVNKILIGNKADLEDQRVVTYLEGEELAAEYGIPFMETSAVLGANVEEAFNKLSELVYFRLEAEGYIFNSQYGGSGSTNGGNSDSNKASNSRIVTGNNIVDPRKSHASGNASTRGQCCGTS